MRSVQVCKYLVAFVIFLLPAYLLMGQKKEEKKYPALLWEITGNGLKKPSYLFGTMHVSSKLVFHLSDSFYLDIRNSDVVALELDPQLWQDQLFRYQHMQTNLRFYTQGAPGDYINEKSFQLEKYDDKLKAALSGEPTLINGLLYRTYQTKADFEEDTYLDLYIYQTGKKLGKQATGVENYFETEQLVMEAAQDMMRDKKKKNTGLDGESPYEIEKKTQDAYRKGDLDLLDSLEKIMQPSDAYMEKFLYRRNEIQARSIDSIIKRHSLFVGVGAAHLPGKRGVIEILRKKGYFLRPVLMPDRDANQKEDIDKIRVPVHFSPFTADDGGFSVQLPGKMYKRADSRSTDSWQYADMSNGAYYMISRVKTHGCFLGHREDQILKKMDSLLYENIPGKILKKTFITRSGYKGIDVTGKTRRGDIQRYNILASPYEVLVFKMSGTNNYVEGKEADQFFNSIEIRRTDAGSSSVPGWSEFAPPRGGFKVRLPGQPFSYRNISNTDGITRWEYEAGDSVTGDAYLIWKKTIQNYRFLEEDTVDLSLAEESFHLSDWIAKGLSRQTGMYKGYPCLDASYLGKDGSFIQARFLLKGADYYLLASRRKGGVTGNGNTFFSSFAFVPYRYPVFKDYVDTFINIRVITPVVPDIDAGMRTIIERAGSEEFLNEVPDYNRYWTKAKTALFRDDSTGETVFVSMETFPKYYYPKDSAVFWKEQADEKRMQQDFIILNKEPFHFSDPADSGKTFGYKYTLSDTNSSRLIYIRVFEMDNRFYRVVNLADSLQGQEGSDFIRRFYSSLLPVTKKGVPPANIFTSKLDLFFKDFYSKDSLISKRAKEAIPNVYFGPNGVGGLIQAIGSLRYNDKDYFTTKSKLINELGYIDDSAAATKVVRGLKSIYEKAGDTSTFQNAVLKALAHSKTQPAYDLLKILLVQDPPVFDNESDYNYLFQDLGDSLALARSLFPGLLQLAAVDDYKENIQSLLTSLVDSGYLKGTDYESYFSQLYFDAKIQWKKQEGRDEKKLQKKTDDNGDDDTIYKADGDQDGENPLHNYAVLLMPFYDKNAGIPHFFDKLLQSRDSSLRLGTVILLLRNHKTVPDAIIQGLAASDQYRSRLLREMENNHLTERFPRTFFNQPAIARSLLVSSGKGENDFWAIQYVDKRVIQFKQKKGYLFYFKYKINKEDDWQIGLSGLQPIDPKEVSTKTDFVRLTNKKIKPDSPVLDQFDNQLKRFLFSKRKSAASFYQDYDYFNGRNEED